MNVKLWAGVAAMIVVLSASGMLLEGNAENRDDKVVITARVNAEGSGIFFAGDPTTLVERDINGNFIDFKSEGWMNKIFMTPGPSTIQHTMLAEIVHGFGTDWEFRENKGGDNPSGNYVFYQVTAPNNMKTTFEDKVDGIRVDGGIIWESYFTDILITSSKTVHEVVQTGELSPEHACCIVAVNRTFAENSPEAVSRFLAAYSAAVDWVKEALSKPSSDEYDELVTIAMSYTKNTNRAVVEEAFKNVEYLFELGTLENDIANLLTQFQQIPNTLRHTPEELGFADAADFADWFVDDKYLEGSRYIRLHPEELTDWKSVNLAILTGDIHQIASQVAKVKGFFTQYKVSVNMYEQTAGGDVMKQLMSGNVDIGFCGAPPAIINTINMYA